MLVFPNQAVEELAASGTGEIQPLMETENLQIGLEQPAVMAELGQPAVMEGMEQSVNPADMENLTDLAAPQTDGEHLQMADAAEGLTKTEEPAETFQVKSPRATLNEQETRSVSEGEEAEPKSAVKTEAHGPEEFQKETKTEGIAVRKDREEEHEEISQTGEVTNKEGIQSPVGTVHGRQEAVSHETAQVHVSQPEELPQELAKELTVKAAAGQNEFEIQITPKHLGEITVRVMQEGGVSVVSIVCSEKKTMELLAQSAREIGTVMEQNLGKPTEIYVEKQENENPWQEQRENDHSGRESEQHRQREQNEKMKAAKNARFLQELRLGLMR